MGANGDAPRAFCANAFFKVHQHSHRIEQPQPQPQQHEIQP